MSYGDLPELRKGTPRGFRMWLNALRLVVLSNRIRVAAGGHLEAKVGRDGTTLRAVNLYRPFWVKLIVNSGAGDGKYSWVYTYRDAGGVWHDDTQGGTFGADYALEANGNSSVPVPSYHLAERQETTGEVLFRASACATGG